MTDKQAQRVRAMYHGGATDVQIASALKLPLAIVRHYIETRAE